MKIMHKIVQNVTEKEAFHIRWTTLATGLKALQAAIQDPEPVQPMVAFSKKTNHAAMFGHGQVIVLIAGSGAEHLRMLLRGQAEGAAEHVTMDLITKAEYGLAIQDLHLQAIVLICFGMISTFHVVNADVQ